MIKRIVVAFAVGVLSLTPTLAHAQENGVDDQVVDDDDVYPPGVEPTPEVDSVGPQVPVAPPPAIDSQAPAAPGPGTLPVSGSNSTDALLRIGTLLLVAGGIIVIASHRRRTTAAA